MNTEDSFIFKPSLFNEDNPVLLINIPFREKDVNKSKIL